MNQTQETQDPKLPFWKFLVGFVLLEVAIVALSALGSGCSTVDPDAVYEIYTNIVVRIPDSSAQDAKKGETSTSGSAGESASSTATDGKDNGAGQGEKPASSSSSVALNWKYGGFNGGKAVEDPRCQISNLHVSDSGLSFKWLTDIPGDWKRQKDEKGVWVIAAVFYKDGSGKWIGGKFDLIDRSRATRDFKNIDSGYNGWNASAFRAAKKHAYCIASADGKWRSNVIED